MQTAATQNKLPLIFQNSWQSNNLVGRYFGTPLSHPFVFLGCAFYPNKCLISLKRGHWVLAVFEASTYLAIISIAVIGTVHVFCVSFYRSFPTQANWLSDFSSGIGLGYAFLFLLPKIGELSAGLAESGKWENSLYSYSLLGFLIYYLLEASRDLGEDNRLSLGLDTVALGTYNCLLAITVMQATATSPELYVIGTLAYSLHLFGVNIYLYKTHPGHMSGWLRVYFVASLAVGILIGLNADKSSMIYSIATGLTGGVIIALSLRVKLPSGSTMNTKALLIGVVFAAVAIVVTRY